MTAIPFENYVPGKFHVWSFHISPYSGRPVKDRRGSHLTLEEAREMLQTCKEHDQRDPSFGGLINMKSPKGPRYVIYKATDWEVVG